jgi:hypothetical protein
MNSDSFSYFVNPLDDGLTGPKHVVSTEDT